MTGGPVQRLAAWAALYLVGAWVLLLQVLRTHFLVPRVRANRDLDLSNVTVVLTGASSGIGRALCGLLLARRAVVVAVCRPRGGAPAGCTRVICADLHDPREARAASGPVRSALVAAGRPRAVLVHAAGALCPGDSRAAAAINLVSPAVLSASLLGAVDALAFLGSAAQAAAPRAPPFQLCTPASPARAGYPTAKALLHPLAEAWAMHARRPAVVVHPGVVATAFYDAEQAPLRRLLRPLVHAVAWDAEQSALRVLDVLRRTGVLSGGASDAGAHAEYWDTTTMARAKIPRMVRGDRDVVRRELSDKMWSEVSEIINRVDDGEKLNHF